MNRIVALGLLAMVVLALPACAADPAGGSRRKLKSPETIQGILCTKYAHFYEDNTLRACFLAEETEISGHDLPKGTQVYFDSQGRLDFCFLGQNSLIEGHLCRGQGHGYMTSFHSNGRLRVCWLKHAEEIEGVPCRRATMLADVFGETVGVYFGDKGQLESCEIDRAVTLDGQRYRRGDRFQRQLSRTE